MILLVAPSNLALPAVAIPTAHKRLILDPRRLRGEEQLRGELKTGAYHLVISTGFAAAADRRLSVCDLLQASRVYGGADIFLDLPAYQAPGAISGSLCTVSPEDAEPPTSLLARKRRYPPVYAFDNHAFWVARTAQAAGVPSLVLRAVVLPAAPGEDGPPSLLFGAPDLMSGRVGPALLRLPGRWRDLSRLMRDAARCRSQLASALTILLVLHERK
jgi:hypothetical protein